MRKLKPHGYTVIEVLIVVAILLDVAVIALPSLMRARTTEQNTRFVNDLRVISSAFEQYSAERYRWPVDAAASTFPPGMDLFLGNRVAFNGTPVGGAWDWDYNVGGVRAAVTVNLTGVLNDPVRMQDVDKIFDYGILTTGAFRQATGNKYI